MEVCNPAVVLSDTIPEDRAFNVFLGSFLLDVELKNITFSTGLLTIEECNARGYTIQEHRYANKSFSLHVPFDADVVLKTVWTAGDICTPLHLL